MKEDFNTNDIHILSGKYLNNEISPDELRLLYDWRNKSEANEKYFKELQETHKLTTYYAHTIHIDVEKAKKNVKQRLSASSSLTKKQSKPSAEVRPLRYTFLNYAASIILLIGIAAITYYLTKDKPREQDLCAGISSQTTEYAYIHLPSGNQIRLTGKKGAVVINSNEEKHIINGRPLTTYEVNEGPEETKFTEISLPAGYMYDITLPDQSVIKLNAGSVLRMKSKADKGKREVALHGEAFFKITRNEDQTFIVYTHKSRVEVLGTTFTILTNADSDVNKTTLIEEGSLRVVPGEDTQNAVILQPGQQANISGPDNELIVDEVDTEIYASWKDGYLTFRSEKFSHVLTTLEKYYRISFKIKEPEIGERTFSGKLILDNDIPEVLKILNFAIPFDYEFRNSTCIIRKHKP
jgi:transmembrane sensor